MCYRVMLAKQDHIEVISIHRFKTRPEAERYIRYIFRNREHAAFVFESDEEPNVEFWEDMTWRIL